MWIQGKLYQNWLRGIHVNCFARGIQKGEINFLAGINNGGYYVLCVIMCYQIKVMLYVVAVMWNENIGKILKEFLMKTWKICLSKKLKHAN